MSSFRSPLAFLVWFALLVLASGRLLKNDKVHWTGSAGPALKARAGAPIVEDRSTQNFQFLSPATERKIPASVGLAYANYTLAYRVTSLPDVPFDIGELYAGLIPIDLKNKSRALYFVYQPTIGKPVDEIVIWLNGGPGTLYHST